MFTCDSVYPDKNYTGNDSDRLFTYDVIGKTRCTVSIKIALLAVSVKLLYCYYNREIATNRQC